MAALRRQRLVQAFRWLQRPIGCAAGVDQDHRGRGPHRPLQAQEHIALERQAAAGQILRLRVEVAAGRHEQVLGVGLETVPDKIEERRQIGIRGDCLLQLRDLVADLLQRRLEQCGHREPESLQLDAEIGHALAGRRDVLVARLVGRVADQQRPPAGRRGGPTPTPRECRQQAAGGRCLDELASAQAADVGPGQGQDKGAVVPPAATVQLPGPRAG